MTAQDKITKIASYYGFDSQCDVAVEEMAELTKAICKYKRSRTSQERENLTFELEEEIADVEIMIRQLKYLCHSNYINAEIERKLDRQLKRIEEEKANGNNGS